MPRSGWYLERDTGREWRVRVREDGVCVCDSRDGWQTAASVRTFGEWDWEFLR